MSINQLTMIDSPTFGRFYFDAVFLSDHTTSVTLTQHPVQRDAAMADHAINNPNEVVLEIGMTDTIGDEKNGRSVNAYKLLRTMQRQRERLKLITRLYSYTDMVITTISSPDDFSTQNSVKATITFQEARSASVSTINVQEAKTSSSKKNSSSSSRSSSSSGSKTNTTTSTSTSTTKPSTSVLAQMAGKG